MTTGRRDSMPQEEGGMSSEQVIEAVHLHSSVIKGGDVVLLFDAKPDGLKRLLPGSGAEVELSTIDRADGRHEVRVKLVNDVAWSRVGWLIDRLRECEAKFVEADAIVAGNDAGDFDLEAWKESLRVEGELRFKSKVESMLGGAHSG